jgi:hypothetical protein
VFEITLCQHGLLHSSSRKRGAQPAFSSPIEATGRAVMGQSMRLKISRRESFDNKRGGNERGPCESELGHLELNTDIPAPRVLAPFPRPKGTNDCG